MLMKSMNMAAAVAAMLMLAGCAGEPKASFKFDGSKEMSGAKFALKDINPGLPADWDAFNFVVLEYKITTAQRFQLGFTTDRGYNELRVMSYVPNAWNKLAVPLRYFTELPDPAVDLAATYNHARYTGWINLGGKRGPLHGVDSVGVRIRRAIGEPEITIRNITLAVEDPGDAYMEDHPAIDSLGQSMLVAYPEKVASLEELRQQWAEEDAGDFSTAPYNYSKFGGYLQKQVEATGFFHVKNIDGRWWFVDPEGYLFLSVGVDCVGAGSGGNIRDYSKRPNMYQALPPETLAPLGRRTGERMYSLGAWNLYRRYGDDYREKANDMIIRRMDKWGINTIANWSSREVMDLNRKAFLLPLGDIGLAGDMMGLADVYDSGFLPKMEASISRSVTPLKDNPWLIGYFMGNEPAWIGQESRLCQLILDGKERPVRGALRDYLSRNGDTDVTRRSFVLESFDKFLEAAETTLKKYDPNHLNLGIRFGDPNSLQEDLLAICGKYFDVFSFNCYMLKPETSTMDRALAITGLPMIIGEYHFGTVDRGLAQSLWQVESQVQRGVAYRYYTENAYAHPGLVGTGYFQWCDQDITGRFDGENYNCGLVDVTDRPYKEQVEAMSETAKRLYEVHSGTIEPFDEKPRNARGHGGVPDLWNE